MLMFYFMRGYRGRIKLNCRIFVKECNKFEIGVSVSFVLFNVVVVVVNMLVLKGSLLFDFYWVIIFFIWCLFLLLYF